jgi:hypothetical protein
MKVVIRPSEGVAQNSVTVPADAGMVEQSSASDTKEPQNFPSVLHPRGERARSDPFVACGSSRQALSRVGEALGAE